MSTAPPLDRRTGPWPDRADAAGPLGSGSLPATALDAARQVASLLATGPAAVASPGSPAPPVPEVRVGADLVEVAEVVRSVETFGDRYLRRIFTPHELECCRAVGTAGYSFDSLASRFAAKEAALKVLRPDGPRPEWRSIEVHRSDSGWCDLRLTGLAARLAEQAGIEQLAVSMTHAAGSGAAVVVALAPSGAGDMDTITRERKDDGRDDPNGPG